MRSPFAHSRCNHLTSLKLHQQLGFQRMAFLLATVVALLFFWGRSLSISPTSTTITFHSHPG
nr:hypothetical protein [Leptolyngbya sp. NK1-12]